MRPFDGLNPPSCNVTQCQAEGFSNVMDVRNAFAALPPLRFIASYHEAHGSLKGVPDMIAARPTWHHDGGQDGIGTGDTGSPAANAMVGIWTVAPAAAAVAVAKATRREFTWRRSEPWAQPSKHCRPEINRATYITLPSPGFSNNKCCHISRIDRHFANHLE